MRVHLQTLPTHLLMLQISLMRSWDKTSLPYSLVCRAHTRTHCLINPSELLLSQAAPPCGMVVFSFLSMLWKPDGIFSAQQGWSRSHVYSGF